MDVVEEIKEVLQTKIQMFVRRTWKVRGQRPGAAPGRSVARR